MAKVARNVSTLKILRSDTTKKISTACCECSPIPPWDSPNVRVSLQPLRCLDPISGDYEYNNVVMECSGVEGSPDDYWTDAGDDFGAIVEWDNDDPSTVFIQTVGGPQGGNVFQEDLSAEQEDCLDAIVTSGTQAVKVEVYGTRSINMGMFRDNATFPEHFHIPITFYPLQIARADNFSITTIGSGRIWVKWNDCYEEEFRRDDFNEAFEAIIAMEIDSQENIYVASNLRLNKYDRDGNILWTYIPTVAAINHMILVPQLFDQPMVCMALPFPGSTYLVSLNSSNGTEAYTPKNIGAYGFCKMENAAETYDDIYVYQFALILGIGRILRLNAIPSFGGFNVVWDSSVVNGFQLPKIRDISQHRFTDDLYVALFENSLPNNVKPCIKLDSTTGEIVWMLRPDYAPFSASGMDSVAAGDGYGYFGGFSKPITPEMQDGNQILKLSADDGSQISRHGKKNANYTNIRNLEVRDGFLHYVGKAT